MVETARRWGLRSGEREGKKRKSQNFVERSEVGARLTLVKSTSISEDSSEGGDRVLRGGLNAVDGLSLSEREPPDLARRRVR